MNERRLLNTFLDLVKIDSPSKKEADLANYCAGALRSCGCSVDFDKGGKKAGSNTGNLYAVLNGDRAGSMIFTAHMDCVDPCEGVNPIIENDRVFTDGTTVLGGDDKAGIAVIIEAIRSIVENKDSHPTIKVIFTVQEETGLYGAKALDVGDFVKDEPCFVLDTHGRPGTVNIAAPYNYIFNAKFIGKSAHAGVEPELGVNSIAAAARAIDLMSSNGNLGRVGEWCTSNVGFIEGGTARNVVAPECKIQGECRAIDKDECEELRQNMVDAMNKAAADFGAKVEQDWELLYDGYSFGEDDKIVQMAIKAARACGFEPNLEKSTGGSDANVFSGRGLSPVVIGVGMENYHTVNEYIDIEDLYGTARLVHTIMADPMIME